MLFEASSQVLSIEDLLNISNSISLAKSAYIEERPNQQEEHI